VLTNILLHVNLKHKKIYCTKNHFHVCIFAAYMHAFAYNLGNFPIESLALILHIVCICRYKLQQFVQTFLQMATPLKEGLTQV
jgi:hypothetical protein